MNLYRHILKLYKDENKWNYYAQDFKCPINEEMAKNFIARYFEAGAKKLMVSQFIDELSPMRHMHVVSAFFIGLLIKDKLCPDLQMESPSWGDYEFGYLWFLVCLFHDMGYVVENDWTYKYVYRKNRDIFLKKYHIKKNFVGSKNMHMKT